LTVEGAWPSAQFIVESAVALVAAVCDHEYMPVAMWRTFQVLIVLLFAGIGFYVLEPQFLMVGAVEIGVLLVWAYIGLVIALVATKIASLAMDWARPTARTKSYQSLSDPAKLEQREQPARRLGSNHKPVARS
jgi:small-conductance mechanosensitive channel